VQDIDLGPGQRTVAEGEVANWYWNQIYHIKIE
jgi:hypothetical protein